jgi:hypothetical protein
MATTNGINYNQTRGLLLSTDGKNRVIVSTGGTTTFTGDTNGGTVLSVSGTNGGLFSVVDTNTGILLEVLDSSNNSLFSVGDTTTGTLLEVLDNSNNPIFQVGTVDKIKISGLTSATDPNVLTIDSSGVVHTSSFIRGSGTPNEITYFSASGTVSSLTTGTYPSLTELSYVKSVTSPIQTQLDTKISSFNNINILAYQALGSTIKGATLDLGLNRASSTVSHGTSGRFQLTPIYIPVATTITGVKFMSAIQGVYTASTYNGIGLYSYSGGVGTLLANTADDSTMWKQNANVLVSRNFTGSTPGPVSVAAGLYYIGSVVNGNTAQAGSTAPSILGTASMTTSMTTYDFTNSARLFTHLNTQTTQPSSWNMTSGQANGAILWFGLF